MNEALKRLGTAAVVMLLVTVLAVALLQPALPAFPVEVLLLLGVFAAAVFGGLWAGVLATAIGAAGAYAMQRSAVATDAGYAALAVFVLAGLSASLIVHFSRRTGSRARAAGAAQRRTDERVMAEARLASTEQGLRTVVDTLPDIVFTADVEGRLHVLNGHWLDIASAQAEEPVILLSLVHPDDAARVRRSWDESIASGAPLDVRCRLRGGDRQYRWVLARAQVRAAAKPNGGHWFGVIVDIDKTVAAERALRDSDERLQLALAATGLGSFEMDFASGEHRLNETARAMLGFELDAALTAGLIEGRIEPRDLERVRAVIAKARADGDGAQFDIEYRFRRPDDTWRWISMRGKCFGDPATRGALALRCLGTLHDVTDRRDAARALAAAAERLRLALEATDLGLWDYDFTTDTAVCSGRVHAIAGLDEGAAINQAVWLALVAPEDLQGLVEHVLAAIRPGADGGGADTERSGALDIEYRLRRASDGAVRWVALTGRVTFDEGVPPRPVRATGTLRDVTRRRESVERLRHSEERLALAQQAGRIGMFDWDLATGALACSITEEALLGLGPGGFPGTYSAMRDLVHPAHRHQVETTLRLALDQQDSYADEFRIVRPDGAVRWISAQATITRSENRTPLRMIGVHRDITDDKLAAQKLEASEERFRLATEALEGLIYDYDPIDDHVERSRGLYELTGFHAGDVPPTGAWWRGRIHADDLDRTVAAFDKAVLEGAPRMELEYRVRHRDGHWVHAHDRSYLVWRNGVVARMVGVTIDVTERRRIERVLRDADRRKDEFLAVLAHELRNPLAPIRNAVQVIARAQQLDAVAGAAAILERQVAQMVRLIDDLLDVSRIAQGKLKLRRQLTALVPVIDAAIETVQPLLRAKRQVFERTLPAPPVTLEADAVRLSQVIANLLHNAIKYTPDEGRISLAADADEAEGMIEIRVADTGIGISPQSLESVFTMFSQLAHDGSAEGSAVGKQDGLGIGLALARAVVNLHGGTIAAFSEGIGRGAEFVLRLPMNDDARAARRAGTAAGQPRRTRVLVVDDNRDSAESLAAVLRLDAHEVLVAYGGREALRIAEVQPLDLILLDIGMPDMDGYEVARRLRASEQAAPVRIVALSGYGQAGDREKSFAAGCDGHLVKPVAPDDLAAWLTPGPARETSRAPTRS